MCQQWYTGNHYQHKLQQSATCSRGTTFDLILLLCYLHWGVTYISCFSTQDGLDPLQFALGHGLYLHQLYNFIATNYFSCTLHQLYSDHLRLLHWWLQMALEVYILYLLTDLMMRAYCHAHIPVYTVLTVNNESWHMRHKTSVRTISYAH